jgi:rhodanese-related sulfurtransferase
MKPLALLCATLLCLNAALAEDPAPSYVELKAAQAIELVQKDAAATKADPKKEPLTVLDVRTPEEYAKGHIAGAKNLDYQSDSFKQELAKLDKSKPCLLHCAAGGRSAKTRELMKALGFKMVYHLEGGLTAWTKAGGPVTPPEKP